MRPDKQRAPSVRPSCRAVLVAIALLGYAGPAAAKPKLVVTAPDSATGDGATPVEVTVRVEPASEVDELADLELTASAGTVGAATPAGDAAVSYQFVPPRVAADTPVTLTAAAKRGRRTVRATASLDALAPTATLGTESTGGAYDLRVPDRVRLGRDTSIELSIARSERAMPQLFVSAGSVSALAVDGDRLRATYTPPDSGAPELAIVAVVSADRATVDWARVPLVGQGRLKLRSEPNASVVVRVDDTDFGPVRTDAKGKAELVVEAPPGVEKARTLATDDLGNVRRGSLRLDPPPFVRSLVVCPSVGGRTLVLVVDETTAPADDAAVALTASIGSVSKPTVAEPGVVAADYSLSADAAFGDPLQIDATLGDAAAGSCATTIPGEMPEGVTIELAPDAYVAGSGEPVRVTARLRYPGKLPPIEVPIVARVDAGELSFDGQTGTWTPPDDFAGRQSAELAASADGIEQRARLPLRPGPALAPAVTASDVSARANGRESIELRVELRDAYGNPIRDAELSAEARGRVSAWRADGDGGYAADYVTPKSYEPLVDTVRVSGAGVEGAVAIELSPIHRRFSLAATGGYVTNFGKVATPAVFVDAGYRLPILGDRLTVGVEAGFYASDDERAAVDMEGPVRTKVTAVPVLARASYEVPIGSAAVYGGAAAGALLSEREVSGPGAGRIVHSGPRFAASAHLGGELRLGRGSAILEVGFLYAAIDDAEIEGNAGGLRLGAGYRFEL